MVYGSYFFAIIIGVGNGVVGATVNGAVADLNLNHLSRSLNRLHMFFAIGCTLGPLISGLVLNYYSEWRIVYYIDALIGLFILLLVNIQIFSKGEIKKEIQSKFNLKDTLKIKVFY